MNLDRRKLLCFAGAAIASSTPPSWLWAGAYPDRTVRMIIPFAPGGVADVVARLVSQKLQERLGRPFPIENIGGGGGNIGTARAKQAAPDGYTVLFTAPAFVINPALQEHVPYDPLKDFTPVTLAASTGLVLLVNPSVQAGTVKQLVDIVRASPGKYSFASAGVGTPPHLIGELFRQSLSLDLVHIPYNSGGQTVAAVVAGHTPISFAPLGPAVPLVKEGKLRALAVASRERSQILSDVPTLVEAGYPGIEGEVWAGALVPAGTSEEVVGLLQREIARAIALPDVKERLTALGYAIVGSTPEEFARQIRDELLRWNNVVRTAGIRASGSMQ